MRMKRRLNFTGKKKIPAKNIQIQIIRDNGVIKTFDAKINLRTMDLPQDAAVFVEAYYRLNRKRFNFGTVGTIIQPPDTGISDLGKTENLSFRVKVVEKSGKYGLILAEADTIRPKGETGPDSQIQSILPSEFGSDLGQQIWRLRYDSQEPILEFNKNIPNIRSLAKSDTGFFFYVYPQVIRELLTYMLLVEFVDPLDPAEEWQKNWLDFARTVYPENYPDQWKRDIPESKGEILAWIENVVTDFSMSHAGVWDRFLKSFDGGQAK